MGWISSDSRGWAPCPLARIVRVLLVLGVVVLAGCGASRPSAEVSSRRSFLGEKGSVALVARGRVLFRGLENPEAYSAGGSLYVVRQVTPLADAHVEIISELMRVSPVSGRVLATRRLASVFDQALLADGSLWVSSSLFTAGSGTWLWRLDPSSLAVRARTMLPGAGRSSSAGSLAIAGGQLWVGTETLSGVSLSTGRVERETGIRYPGGIQVAADAAGRVLLASVGSVHPTYIERLNLVTGALRARSASIWSVNKPLIGGVVDGGGWVSDATGMMGDIFRVNIDTLRSTRTEGPTAIATNGMRAQVVDGILWVTQPAGGDARNYCGDPATGTPLAPLPLPGDSIFLTADRSRFYYEPVDSSPAELASASIPAACRAKTAAARSAATASPPPCALRDVMLSVGSQFDSATGEHDDLIVVTNRSPGSCTLDGYPVITLGTRTQRLPFTYARGGRPYVTLQRPRRVTLAHGGHGYFLVAKYRCDGGIVHAATVIRVSLPETVGSIALQAAGVHELDYCRKYPGDRRIDPGNRVAISPIEAALKQALAGPA